MLLLLLLLEVLLLKWSLNEFTNGGLFEYYRFYSWRFHVSRSVAGCPLLSAGSAQLRLPGQFQRLGLHWAGVARSCPLWPVAHHVSGEALHRAAAGRRGRQDPPPTRHHRDLLDREPLPPSPPTPSLVDCLHQLDASLPTCRWARDVWRWLIVWHSPKAPPLFWRFSRLWRSWRKVCSVRGSGTSWRHGEYWKASVLWSVTVQWS